MILTPVTNVNNLQVGDCIRYGTKGTSHEIVALHPPRYRVAKTLTTHLTACDAGTVVTMLRGFPGEWTVGERVQDQVTLTQGDQVITVLFTRQVQTVTVLEEVVTYLGKTLYLEQSTEGGFVMVGVPQGAPSNSNRWANN